MNNFLIVIQILRKINQRDIPLLIFVTASAKILCIVCSDGPNAIVSSNRCMAAWKPFKTSGGIMLDKLGLSFARSAAIVMVNTLGYCLASKKRLQKTIVIPGIKCPCIRKALRDTGNRTQNKAIISLVKFKAEWQDRSIVLLSFYHDLVDCWPQN